MALTVAELQTRLTADTRDLQMGLRRAESSVQSFAATGGAAMKAFGGAIAGVAATQGLQMLADFLAGAIKGASDLAEAANATGVAFQSSTPQVVAWANSLSAAFGATNVEALNAASQFQLVTREAGLTGDQITDLAERAFDLGSVFNASAADVSTAIKSGLVGETEPLRRFGVILNQDKIEAEALAMGLIKAGEEMSDGEKQAAAYSLIMRETAFAQGDATTTAESAAGQMRQLHVNVQELKDSIGVALLPILTTTANFLNTNLVPAFASVVGVVGDWIAQNVSLAQSLLRLPAGVLDKIGFDGFAEDLRGVADGLEDLRVDALHVDDSFRGLTDSFIANNAAGGAAAMSAKDLAGGLDKVGTSAEDAAKAAEKATDAFFSLGDANFALEDAQLAAGEAQDELNKLLATGGVDAEKVADATEDLVRAKGDLTDATDRVNEALEDYNQALARATADHLRDVERATDDYRRAQEKLAEETQDVADAEAKLAKLKAQRKARDEAIKAAKAQLAAADTVTERIIAQDALNAALGMEIVTDEELAAAASDVTVQQDEQKTAASGLDQAQKGLNATLAENPALSDSVVNAAERLETARADEAAAANNVTTAQNALNQAQLPAPGYEKAVEEATRAVERAYWDVEKATWAADKAQRAYNQALNEQPKTVSTTFNETHNITENRKLNVEISLPALPASGSGTVVPLQMRPTLVMHDGGMVPGPRGSEVPALLEAGERVIPAGGGGGGMSDRPIVVQLVADGKVIQEILLGHQRRSGALGFN